MRRFDFWVPAVAAAALCSGCGAGGDSTAVEAAVSIVSGALNNTTGSAVGYAPPRAPKSPLERALDAVNPIGTAWAATWTCTGGTLAPAYSGPAANPYTYTPVSCSVEWANGKSASSVWSSTFTLEYGASCDTTHAFILNQVGGCTVTRTTGSAGNTRTLTGPDGASYAVTHDSHGAGTGWDSSVAPAPSNGGVVATCAAGGCSQGGTLVVSGSHLFGTVTTAAGRTSKLWDHTVSTVGSGLALATTGTNRVLNGAVLVQHNLAKFTSTATFKDVTYAGGACCFPTAGSVTSEVTAGAEKGRTESLTFGSVCGEATYTGPQGKTTSLTLQHCI